MGTGQHDFQNPSSFHVDDFTTYSRSHPLAECTQSPLYQLLWDPETSRGKLTGNNKPGDGLVNTIQPAKTTEARSVISPRTNTKKRGVIFLVTSVFIGNILRSMAAKDVVFLRDSLFKWLCIKSAISINIHGERAVDVGFFFTIYSSYFKGPREEKDTWYPSWPLRGSAKRWVSVLHSPLSGLHAPGRGLHAPLPLTCSSTSCSQSSPAQSTAGGEWGHRGLEGPCEQSL